MIADELTKQWCKMIEQTGTSLNTLARKPIDLGEEDQKELDQIAKCQGEGSCKAMLEINPDQEKLPSGIEQRGDGDEEDDREEEEEKEDDKIDKKANLNDVLARLIPEIAILSGCKQDMMEAMASIMSNPKHREALNEFLIQLYSDRSTRARAASADD
jgi:hypothetical protein